MHARYRTLGLLVSIVLALLSGLATGEEAPAGDRAPFQLMDIYRVTWISDVDISPNGDAVVLARTTSDLERAVRETRIWRVDADGKHLVQLTSGKGRDWSPRWSPDGSRIGFLSTRSGAPNVFTMAPDGTDVRQETDLSLGVGGFVWSPTGNVIALDTTIYPECGIDDACNSLRDRLRTRGPLQAHVADDLLYRHWDDWRDGRRTALLLLDLNTQELRAVDSGPFDTPAYNLNGAAGYAFSPDGKELCFTSNQDPDPALSTNVDLFVVPVSGGTPRAITADNDGWDAHPAYSPDGRFIAYLTQKTPRYESDLISIALYDRNSGTSRVLTDRFDNWVDRFAWVDDGRSIVFTGEYHGRTPLYRVDISTGRVVQLVSHGRVDRFDLGPRARWIAVVRRTVAEPQEVYRLDVRRGRTIRKSTKLTRFNDALVREVDFRPAEELWVDGAGGAKIHVFVIKPHGFEPGRRYPLILNVHGGPQSQWYDGYRSDWQLYAGAGYVVAFANPHGSTGYGQAFTAQISGDWGGWVFEDLMKVTDALEKLPCVDPERMGAMGWSFGGYMMNWFEAQTNRFKALASMMGAYDLRSFYGATEELWWPEWDLKGTPWTSDLYDKWSPSNYVDNFQTPMLLVTGELDYRIPYTQSLQMFTTLRRKGIRARLIVLEDNGHWPGALRPMSLYYNAHLEWFHEHLGGAPAPWDSRDVAHNRVFEEDQKRLEE